jgi:CDP-glucose 4,6-dehydratase
LDCLSGYLQLAERLHGEGGEAFASAWNFGPRDEDILPVAHVADHLCRLWGDGADWEQDDGRHVHEATSLKLDISKARKHLDWTPTWRLVDALAEAVAFTKAWRDGVDMRATVGRHIAWFEEGRGFDGISSDRGDTIT